MTFRRASWALLMALTWAFSGASVCIAQGPGGFGPPGGGFGGDPTMMILRDDNVKKELEIVESQEEKIRALGDKMRERMRSVFEGFRGETSEENREQRMKEIQAKMQEATAELRKELDTVLLPQQKERLKQLALQARMRFQSTSQALSNSETADALQLTQEQKDKLTEKQKEIDEEYRKESEKLRQKMTDKLLEVLTPEQRAKWKEMVGTPIEFGPPQFGRGGRGGRGGPGGGGGN